MRAAFLLPDDWEGNVKTKKSERKSETRFLPMAITETRMIEQGKAIQGYVAKFGVWADIGWFKEKVRIGAFSKTIRENDVRCLENHDPHLILGRTSARTLELREDDIGLWFRSALPETQYAKDLKENIDNGNITGCSFMFDVINASWNNDLTERELIEVRLFDVGPVTFPAYEQTEVQARDARSVLSVQARRDLEGKTDIDWEALSIALMRVKRGQDSAGKYRGMIVDHAKRLEDLLAEGTGGDPAASADTTADHHPEAPLEPGSIRCTTRAELERLRADLEETERNESHG